MNRDNIEPCAEFLESTLEQWQNDFNLFFVKFEGYKNVPCIVDSIIIDRALKM